ncbi:hypothetical protein Thal_0012 [Thermocrinis albus DSM 14484]|uniref:Uncharacterized protein n=1 Tax=Thermocrinis albus (strain DSM 14484 / JCM 11386 / HI 11/12) TaxID=638303 RepID=D3SNB3_THEAH|nr:TM1812 family CRISPR-associated protein [Thermocrinis albus]ADC88650.1 hypothetical protein Thal_0012 [Thermocrinis albus DSM 14484]
MGGSESKKHKVIIAPWGDCKSWKSVEYKYKSDEIKANTTLKVLCHDLKPDGVLVLVPDTLFGSNKLFGNGSAKDKVGRYEDLINRVREKVYVVTEKKVERRLHFTDTMEILLKGWFVSELLDLYQPNIDMEEGINLSELKKFTERIYKDRWTAARINRDLGELEESLKKLEADKEWKLYAEVIGKDENEKEPQVDPRNLVAHSGLLYHTTEIKRDGDELYARLREGLKDEIKKQLPCQDI